MFSPLKIFHPKFGSFDGDERNGQILSMNATSNKGMGKIILLSLVFIIRIINAIRLCKVNVNIY